MNAYRYILKGDAFEKVIRKSEDTSVITHISRLLIPTELEGAAFEKESRGLLLLPLEIPFAKYLYSAPWLLLLGNSRG